MFCRLGIRALGVRTNFPWMGNTSYIGLPLETIQIVCNFKIPKTFEREVGKGKNNYGFESCKKVTNACIIIMLLTLHYLRNDPFSNTTNTNNLYTELSFLIYFKNYSYTNCV